MRHKNLLPLLSIASIVILFIAMSARQHTDAQQPPLPLPVLPESTAEPLPVDREKYSPARYGVPETLAGFEVLAVVTHEQNPCSPEDFMSVYIQVPQSTASEYLQSPTAAQIDEAMAELNQLYPKAGISTFGPYVHSDVFFAQLDKTMRQAQEVVALGRCYPLGGPRVEREQEVSQNE